MRISSSLYTDFLDFQNYVQLQLKKATVPVMTVEELRNVHNRFYIQQNKDGEWEVYMNICYLGGCDYNPVPYNTERDALVAAVLLTLEGKKPKHLFPCPRCYQEYLEDCI